MIVEVIVRFFLAGMAVAGRDPGGDAAAEWWAPPAAVGERVVTYYAQPLIRDGRVVNAEGRFAVYTVREVLPDHLRVEAEGIDGLGGWARRDELLAFDKALDCYTAIIDQGLDDDAVSWRGLIHFHRGELAEALADFDAAIRLRPTEPWAYRMRAETLAKQDDRAAAIRAYDDLIRREPGKAGDLFGRASLQWREGNYDEVLADADAILALQPGDGRALAFRGGARVERREYAQAIPDLDAAIRLHPDETFSLSKRAIAHHALGNFERAVADLTRCVALDPGQPWGHRALGDTLSARDDDAGAIRAYDEAIRLDPKIGAVWDNRGVCRLALDDLDGALADFDEAVRLSPQNAWALAHRGYVALRQRRFAEAIVDLDRAIALDPTESTTFANRGYARRHRGEPALARADFDQAAALRPDDPDPLVELAWLLAACPEAGVRDGEGAVRAATRACELTRWSAPNALGALAAAHAELEDYERATRRIREALVVVGAGGDNREFYDYLLDLFEKQQPYRLDGTSD